MGIEPPAELPVKLPNAHAPLKDVFGMRCESAKATDRSFDRRRQRLTHYSKK
jgi:hypothetical protein